LVEKTVLTVREIGIAAEIFLSPDEARGGEGGGGEDKRFHCYDVK
jgi:hypothetical protein